MKRKEEINHPMIAMSGISDVAGSAFEVDAGNARYGFKTKANV